MKVKVFTLSKLDRQAGPMAEFEYSQEHLRKLAGELHRNQCLVYLDLKGELRNLENFDEADKIVSELRNLGQQSLVLMKEDFEKFAFYSSIDWEIDRL